MFAIHSPQTVQLTTDNPDAPAAMVNFKTNGADTSRCVMEVISQGRIWTITFNQRGYLISQTFANADEPNPDQPHLTDADYIVNGVDTRAFNPYTHKAPVDADTLYRDGQTPGFKQPHIDKDSDAHVDRKAAIEAAHGDAQKAIDEQRARMDETPEQTVERQRKEREDKLKQVSESLSKTDPTSIQPQPLNQINEPSPHPDVVNTTQGLGGQPLGNQLNRDSAGRTPNDPNYDPFK